tara:strand:+ start:5892 stop:8768 length:2877 start_codon:yes stop_codon:yes gene_type:complete
MFQYNTFKNMENKLSNSSALIVATYGIIESSLVADNLITNPVYSNASLVEHKHKLFGLTNSENLYIKNIKKKSIPTENLYIDRKYLNSELGINPLITNNQNTPYDNIVYYTYDATTLILISKGRELYVYDSKLSLIKVVVFIDTIKEVFYNGLWVYIITDNHRVYKRNDIQTNSPSLPIVVSEIFTNLDKTLLLTIKYCTNNQNVIIIMIYTKRFDIFYGETMTQIFDSDTQLIDIGTDEYTGADLLYTNNNSIEQTDNLLFIIYTDSTTTSCYQYNILYTPTNVSPVLMYNVELVHLYNAANIDIIQINNNLVVHKSRSSPNPKTLYYCNITDVSIAGNHTVAYNNVTNTVETGYILNIFTEPGNSINIDYTQISGCNTFLLEYDQHNSLIILNAGCYGLIFLNIELNIGLNTTLVVNISYNSFVKPFPYYNSNSLAECKNYYIAPQMRNEHRNQINDIYILNAYTGLIKIQHRNGFHNKVLSIECFINDDSYILVPEALSIQITHYTKDVPYKCNFNISNIWEDKIFNCIIFNVPMDIKSFIQPFGLPHFSISELSLHNSAIFYSKHSNFSQSITSIKLITRQLLHNTYSITNGVVSYNNILPGYIIVPEYSCSGSLLFSDNNIPVGFITIKNTKYYILELNILKSLINRYSLLNIVTDNYNDVLALSDDVNTSQNRVVCIDLYNRTIHYYPFEEATSGREYSLLRHDYLNEFIKTPSYTNHPKDDNDKIYIRELYNKNYDFIGYFYLISKFTISAQNILISSSTDNATHVGMSRLFNNYSELYRNIPISDNKTLKILKNTKNYKIKITDAYINNITSITTIHNSLSITISSSGLSYLGFSIIDISSLTEENFATYITSPNNLALNWTIIDIALKSGIQGYIITNISDEFKSVNPIVSSKLYTIILDYTINNTITSLYLLKTNKITYWEYNLGNGWTSIEQNINLPSNIVANYTTI